MAMAKPGIDAREMPVEWIVSGYQMVYEAYNPVEIEKKTASTLLAEDEGIQSAIEARGASWWTTLTSYVAPGPDNHASMASSPSSTSQESRMQQLNCAAQPLALGCDALPMVLAPILVALIFIRVGVWALKRRTERQAGTAAHTTHENVSMRMQ
ncbi:hypothetical protein BBJ28_00021368 [Nothophytophthora sp. Chile5]|nr:hypothetical protein BBJ28_00021368 [Nothophytophthora sp. Chile5]